MEGRHSLYDPDALYCLAALHGITAPHGTTEGHDCHEVRSEDPCGPCETARARAGSRARARQRKTIPAVVLRGRLAADATRRMAGVTPTLSSSHRCAGTNVLQRARWAAIQTPKSSPCTTMADPDITERVEGQVRAMRELIRPVFLEPEVSWGDQPAALQGVMQWGIPHGARPCHAD